MSVIVVLKNSFFEVFFEKNVLDGGEVILSEKIAGKSVVFFKKILKLQDILIFL